MPARQVLLTYSHMTPTEILAYARARHGRDGYAAGYGALEAWVESLAPMGECAWCNRTIKGPPSVTLTGVAYCSEAHRRAAAYARDREIRKELTNHARDARREG